MSTKNEVVLRLTTDSREIVKAVDALLARVKELEAEFERVTKELNAKQAVIDSLMLEFCPNEMTSEQLAEWARSQRPAPAVSGVSGPPIKIDGFVRDFSRQLNQGGVMPAIVNQGLNLTETAYSGFKLNA